MKSSDQVRYFYQDNDVQAVFQGAHVTVFVKAHRGCLAEYCGSDALVPVKLLATDMQASPLLEVDRPEIRTGSYSPYGLEAFLRSQTGFTGQLKEKGGQGYLLGNGYRLYSPALMRFHSPDSMSPFSMGGKNCYVYCSGDPVNFTDRSGHMKVRQPKSISSASRAGSRSPQRLPGSFQADGPRSQSPSSSSDQVWEQMMAHPDWGGGTTTNGAPSIDRAESQLAHSQNSQLISPTQHIAGDNSALLRGVLKNNLKSAVRGRGAQSIPVVPSINREQSQEVVKTIRAALADSLKDAMNGDGSVTSPNRGLTYNNLIGALSVLSQRSNQ